MNTDEERDDLWDLLGKARPPQAAPFLARNVLREIRVLNQERRLSWLSIFARWQPIAAALAVTALAGGGWAVQRHRAAEEKQQLLTLAEGVYTSPDYLVINDLDELLDSEKNSAWLEADVN